MTGHVGVVHDRVAVGNNSCTNVIKPLVKLGRGIWLIGLDQIDLIGSVNLVSLTASTVLRYCYLNNNKVVIFLYKTV